MSGVGDPKELDTSATLDSLSLSAPFDTMAVQLQSNEGSNVAESAIAAAAAAWFAVIREQFSAATISAAAAEKLVVDNDIAELRPFIRALIGVIRAFDGTGAMPLQDLAEILNTDDAGIPLRMKSVLETPNWFTFADRYEDASLSTDRLLDRSRRSSDLESEVFLLGCRIELDLRRGRWNQGRAGLDAALRISHARALPTGYLDVLAAQLAAGQGRREDVAIHLGSARMYAYDLGDISTLWRADAVEAFSALSVGDAVTAEALLQPLLTVPHPCGGGLAAVRKWDADLIEALARLGRVEEARRVLKLLATPFPSTWSSATELRSEALLAEDATTGAAFAERSAEGFAGIGAPFERARSELVAGEIARRAGNGATARRCLRKAIATFEALAAVPWSVRASRELLTAESAGPSGPGSPLNQLTAQERGIVSALLAGASNREIGQRMFISVKTVESHLTRIYQKLEVSSRTQLFALLASHSNPFG
jgi:DNA-binding CsgD family transcriptional regulator